MRHRKVLETLDATQEVTGHTRLHSRRTPRVPPQHRKSHGFPSSSQDEGPFPCFIGKGIPVFPWHLKRRRSQHENREELQGSCHNSIKTPMCQSTTHKSDSPALTRLSPQVSTPNPMAGVTALWHLEGKPPIHMPTRQEA